MKITSNVFQRIAAICLLLFIFDCKKSDDGGAEVAPNGKVVVSANNIEDADVNAPDFWDDTKLVWNDEFDGDSLSNDKWFLDTFPAGFFDTSELQDNVDSNEVLEVSNGTLKIYARKIGDGQEKGDYISARLNGKFSFKYGRLEVRAKVPQNSGNGVLARLWMVGNNIGTVGFPQCGEIDFMNYFSYLPEEYYNTVYTAANTGVNGPPDTSGAIPLPAIDDQFHTYGLLFTDEYLKLYRDNIDNVTFTFNRPVESNETNWPFDQSFYFILNMVVGGEFAGVEGVDDSIFPTVFEIDHVRIYHPE